ncbi:KdsC family phosphatase [Kordiimonas pumila]|uniref:KdsC family phosphatase n=1 Tax=Kordiimonas pumila TaxID=2161677 RepID=A0ABV7D3S7_9PROT|nr:HAD-IIIA family hydrolase [Kordiimonas pumila]
MTIKLLALDVDGVLTDGTLYYTAAGEEMKAFNAQDGMGMKLLSRLGVQVAVISGRKSAALERRLDDLGVYHRRLACGDKIKGLEDICADMGVTLAEVAFMGDDLNDLPVMQVCGYKIAPVNAVTAVIKSADFVTARDGGRGAVREACDHLAGQLGLSLETAASGVTTVLVQ